MKQKINITTDLIKQLHNAQLLWARDSLTQTIDNDYSYSDDGFDYLRSALELAAEMMSIALDRDIDRLDKLLNVEPDDDTSIFFLYACDGIAPAFYDLNPPALTED